MFSQEEVEFKTIDGVTLRGRIWPSKERGPGVVMCPGFNGVKEMVGLPSVAQALQKAGITVLAYDPRTTGLSDGEPRNDIDPHKQIEDYMDALTCLTRHEMVNPRQAGLWGMSLSGATAMTAACFDPRVRFVIAVAPTTSYHCMENKLPKVLAKIAKDRESQVKGNEPYYLPMVDGTGTNPAGFEMGMDKELAIRILSAADPSMATRASLAPNHVNRTTIQSYLRILMWNPAPLWPVHLPTSTPAMFIVPELDELVPAETQISNFHALRGSNNMLRIETGLRHLDVLEGDSFPESVEQQLDFIRKATANE